MSKYVYTCGVVRHGSSLRIRDRAIASKKKKIEKAHLKIEDDNPRQF